MKGQLSTHGSNLEQKTIQYVSKIQQTMQVNYRKSHYMIVSLIIISLVILLIHACYNDNEEELYPSLTSQNNCDTANVGYTKSVQPIMNTSCVGCHGANGASGGIKLDNYENVKSNINLAISAVKAGTMPPGGKLSDCKIAILVKWKKVNMPLDTSDTYTGNPNPIDTANVTYNQTISILINENCLSCHGSNSTNGTYLDTYIHVKANIDKVIVSVKNGTMPKGYKLNDSQIALFEQWKALNMPESSSVAVPPVLSCDTSNITFSLKVSPIFTANCAGCHSGAEAQEDVRLDSYNNIKTNFNVSLAAIKRNSMPPGGKMSNCQKIIIEKWNKQGMPNN
jgi:mono/diheme cytochrome c family protein